MNHIYRLVWNKKRAMLMAVAEVGSAQGKDASGDTPDKSTRLDAAAAAVATVPGARTVLAAALLALFPLAAFAVGDPLVGCTVATGTSVTLSDGDGSNAQASGCSLVNDGHLDIGATDSGTSLLGLSGSGSVQLGGQTLTLTNAGDLFAGTLQGSGGLTLAGGTEIMSGAHTYMGATRIDTFGSLGLAGSGGIALSSGVLVDGVFDIGARAGGAQIQSLSGSGTVLLGGQTLTLTNAGDLFAGAIYGSGGLAVAGGGTVLGGLNAYTGATVIDAGASLALAGSGGIALSSGVANNGVFDIGASAYGAQIQSLSGSGTVLLGGQTLTLTNAHDVFAGTIDGFGGVTVAGGAQVLSGANTYTGVSAIDGGATLALAGSGSIALSAGVIDNGVFDIAATANGAAIQSLAGSGTVLLGGQTLTLTNAGDVFAGTLAGSGGLAIAAGNATLTAASGYSGATTIAQGAALTLADDGSIAASRVRADGVLDIAASNGAAAVKSLGGSGAVLLGGQTLTLTNAGDVFAGHIFGSGGIAIAGGTQVLSGINSYTGATAIGAGGTLALSGSGAIALSSGVVADGVFTIAGTDNGARIRTLSGSGSVVLGSQTLTLTNADGVFSGAIRGAGGVAIESGRETLTGRSTYSGDTGIAQDATLTLAGDGSIASSRVVADGTLDVSAARGAAVKSLAGSGSVLLGGQTLTLTNAGDVFAGHLTGSGGVAIAGGSETLTAAQHYTGATSIAAGATLALSGNGSIAASRTVAVNGTLALGAGGATLQSITGGGLVKLGGGLTLSNAAGAFAGTLAGSGGFDVGNGSATLTGMNTYRGATGVASGATLALGGAGSIAASSGIDVAGKFDISATRAGATVANLTGAGTVALGAQTLTLSAAGGAFDGVIAGSGGLTVGGGSAVLSGANTYTGATTIAHGAALALRGAGGIAHSAVLDNGVFDIGAAAANVSVASLAGSGTVLLGAHDLTLSAASGRFSGAIDGSGGVHVTGGAQAFAGANGYTGATTVSGGTLQVWSDAALGAGSSALALDNGTWRTSADLTHARGLALTDSGTVDVDGTTTTTETGVVSGTGALVKAGAGTLVLNGSVGNGGGVQVAQGTLALTAANTYTGGTTVAKGATLQISSDANLGAAGGKLTLDGGTLQTTATLESARAIAVSAQNGAIDTEGAASVVTLNGNISGAGRIVKDGAGTLVLGGDNGGGNGSANQAGDGWTGGLTINDGLVKVTNAYGLGWGSVMTFNAGTILATVDIATGQDIRMGRATSIDTAANTTTTLAGDLLSTGSGSGCFTKTGAGTLNITGSATIDATCVMEGKLLANGAFSSMVTVAHGAALGGSGTIKGDILVQGTLSPGNSPGMLTADSRITMASGSTFKEDIGGAVQASATSPVGATGYYSYLHVVGGNPFVIQGGSTLAPTLKDLYSTSESGYGSTPYTPQLGQTFRIVTADGGIVGRFDTLVQPDGMAGTRMAAFYNAGGNNSIELKVLPASYATWFKDANANARSVAGALDSVADLDQAGKASTQQDALLYQAGSYDAQQLGGLVRGLAGEVHGALAAAAPQAGWDLQRSVLKHDAADDGRMLWIDLGANRGRWSGDAGASGFHADRVQVTFGADLYRSRDARFGIGASHASTDLSADDASGKLRQNKLFAYGATGAGDLVVDAIASYGRDKVESSRRDPFADPAATLGAQADGNSALLGLGVRTTRTVNGVALEPFARATVQRVERDAAVETPASVAALTLDGARATGTRLVTGFAAASRNADPLQASTYRLNLGVGVDAGGLVRPTQHAVLAGTGIDIGAPDVGRVFAQGGVTGTLQLKKGAYLYFGVSGEARSGYYQVGGNAGARAVF